ncbi:hypothetical protein B0O80DRAFT_232602 [Mortierella sp. GBAus27b]|nr:hypothetical protein BGX31_010059 [Mortierella sp. GBA43]KAI8359507.1 hypothetical protein B0O80DRAFT_232602 [Mortierella sp. GBAus27b]
MENEGPAQDFRSRSTGKDVTIRARVDKSGKYIILWQDVQLAFPTATYALNRNVLVPFMEDDNFERLWPLRIAYQPGVELEVNEAGHTTTTPTQPSRRRSIEQRLQEFRLASPPGAPPSETVTIPARWDSKAKLHVVLWDDIRQLFKNIEFVLHEGLVVDFVMDSDGQKRLSPSRIIYHPGIVLEVVATDGSKDTDCHQQITSPQDEVPSRNLAIDSTTGKSALKDIILQKHSSLYVQINECESILEGIVSKQENSDSGLRKILDDLLMLPKQQMGENEVVSNYLENSKRLADITNRRGQKGYQLPQEIQEGLEKNILNEQEHILDAQQKQIDSLANFQTSFETMATLAFTSHDQPVPRLFIVLPRRSGLSMDQEQLSSDDFRLYFMCECYQRCADQEGQSSGKIHLARHKGYDIDRAQEFFEDYGSYVQAILYILMNGITAPGIHVPSMTHLQLTDGVNQVQDSLNLTTNTIESLIHGTTTFIEGLLSGKDTIDQATALDVFEQADLQPLVHYLKDGYTLGNLCQGITAEGDVRWLCEEHSFSEDRYMEVEDQEDSLCGIDDTRDIEGERPPDYQPQETAPAGAGMDAHTISDTVKGPSDEFSTLKEDFGSATNIYTGTVITKSLSMEPIPVKKSDIFPPKRGLTDLPTGYRNEVLKKSSLPAFRSPYVVHNNLIGVPQGVAVHAAQVPVPQLDQEQVDMKTNRAFLEDWENFLRLRPQRSADVDGAHTKYESSLEDRDHHRKRIIYEKVQQLLGTTFDVNEDPPPRLFIVLPNVTGLRGKLKKTYADQFRLYFLCECGMTTKEIHLAKHEGYDLKNTTKFFEKYGTYLLVMMHMVKYECATTEPIRILEGIDNSDPHLRYLKTNIGHLASETINYLQEIKENAGTVAEEMSDQSELYRFGALKVKDLRLRPFLKIKDQERSPGNMYRIVPDDKNHVKWVCLDHYQETYQGTSMPAVQKLVADNGGRLIEEWGKVIIKIDTSNEAKRFYDAIKAQRIQELEITLGWDTTMEELRTFTKAITAAKVIRLTVDRTVQSKVSALDIVVKRFDPIAQLAFNSGVQFLHLKGFNDFFSRISSSKADPISKLRSFSMDSPISFTGKTIKLLRNFLENCESLRSVDLKFSRNHSIMEAMEDILARLPQLDSLTIDHGGTSFIARVRAKTIQDMFVSTKHLGNLESDDVEIIRRGNVKQLTIENTPEMEDDDRLKEILRSPKLSTLRIGCTGGRCVAVINLVVSTRRRLLQEASSQLRTFELMGPGLVPFDETIYSYRSSDIIHSYLSFDENSAVFDMRTRIHGSNMTTENDPVCDFVREYGWSLVWLRMLGPCYDGFGKLLGGIVDKGGSRLERLQINPLYLSGSELGLYRIIDQSPRLASIDLCLDFVDIDCLERGLSQLSRRFGNRKTPSGLLFTGEVPVESRPWNDRPPPGRDRFPDLTTFDLIVNKGTILQHDYIPWIANMVAAPVHRPESVRTYLEFNEESSSSSIMSSGGPNVEQARLVRVSIEGVVFRPDEWMMVITAIDLYALQELSFADSNFSAKQFELLVDCISGDETEPPPLRSLNIKGSNLAQSTDSRTLREMLDALLEKAPLIKIQT